MAIIEEYNVKYLISKNHASPFAWADYKLNPYRGCFHDCKYCDGRSEKYNMHEDFSSKIMVKTNAAELFSKFCVSKGFLAKSNAQATLFRDELIREKEITVFIASGVCDPYQPAESKYKITRQLLQVAYDYGISVHILTKSALVLRDMDLIKKINDQNYAGVHFSISLAEDKDQKIIEPGGSSTTKRFAVLKKFREESIPSGLYFLPILPFLSDSEDCIKGIYDRAIDANASFVYAGGLTLKPGRNKQVFLEMLRMHYPDLVAKYIQLFGNNHKYGIMDPYQMKKLGLKRPEVTAFTYAYENKMPYAVPRYLSKSRLEANLRFSELLSRILHLKNTIGLPDHDSKEFLEAYYYFESFPRDILSLTTEEIKQLPISHNVFLYLKDFIKNGRSIKLDLLEKKIYEKLKK